ncbi:YfhO family protein [Peptostreptococcus faecalis]|uniref:YfhO family protein n=1 Tax=Peptostreptococcus faecalis TaxID=2045015 RepID=UPI000C7D9F96|nr:YfhO family protein [Peptostreptococcus faecalis]
MNIKKNKKFRVYALYTIGFFILMSIMLLNIRINKLSFVYNADALVQHYPTQFFITEYLSDFIANIGDGIKLFNFNIGLGQDILGTYHYYGITDPLNIILLLGKDINANAMYDLQIILRMFLSGLAFVYMCIHFDNKRGLIPLGALIYVFSNYALTPGIMHPYFINVMYLFPLMIVGVNKLITENNVIFFILVSVLSIITNFYFAYMLAIFTFVYALVKIIMRIKKFKIKSNLIVLFRGIICYLLAVMLSSIVLIPVIRSYLDSYRSGPREINLNLFMSVEEALDYVLNLFVTPNIENFAVVGISIITLFALISLFINRGNMQLKILSILTVFLVLMPKLHSFVNGFSYDNYRWYYVVTLLLSYILVNQYENILEMSFAKKIIMVLVVITYLGTYIYQNFGHLLYELSIKDILIKPINLLPVITAILILMILLLKDRSTKKWSIQMIVSISLCINVFLYINNACSSGVLANRDDIRMMSNNSSLSYVSGKSKHSFERVNNLKSISFNYSDIYNYPSISEYYSIENAYLSKFNLEYKNNGAVPLTRMQGVDERSALVNILSVKYHVGEHKVPYGFKQYAFQDMYMNENYIPFGFMYNNYVKESDLEDYSALEKQEILLKACIIEDNILGVEKLAQQELDEIKLRQNKVDYISSENKVVNNKKEHIVNLNFNLKYSGELYLKIKDMDTFKNNDYIVVESGTGQKAIEFIKRDSNWYLGEKDVIANLGYHNKGTRSIMINIPESGSFNMDDIELECIPASDISENSRKLAQRHLEGVEISNNGFKGSINNTENGLMFVSIPYSEGWKAVVDGKDTKIHTANTGFMAINIKPGKHKVVFEYNRPWQNYGIYVSVLGVLLLIAYLVLRRFIGGDI